MTPKQRVKTALAHREADRVPQGEFATDYSVIEQALGRPTYWRGKRRYYEALWDGRRDEVVESMKRDIVEFTLLMGLAMAPVHAVPHRDFPFHCPEPLDEDTWRDERGSILRYSHQTEDIGLVQPGDKPAPVSGFELPARMDESELELARHVMAELGDTDFVFARPGRFTGLGYVAGWTESMFLRVADDPEGVAAAEMAAAEYLEEAVRPFVEAGVDGVAIGADYGHNHGPFVSPATFAKVYAPALRRQCDILHRMGMPCLFHSCGNNRLILDQMVEAGIDAYQAIQPIERIDEIKHLFGDRITLWGGVSTDTLVRGTPEELRHQALFTLKHCAPGGGLILSSSHSVPAKTPLANYRALVGTGHERGRYPIDIPEDIPEPTWGGA